MKKLIINADDFGLHQNVNAAIIDGYQQGCITSTSLMAGGRAFEDAVTLAKNCPDLGVGVHLTLVAEKPVTAPAEVSTLVDSYGFLPAGYLEFMNKYIMGKFDFDQIKIELDAQIAKVFETGLKITHVDSHQHLHVLPGILEIVIDLARKYHIEAMRSPCEPYFFVGGYPAKLMRMASRMGLSFLAKKAQKKVRKEGFLTPDHFFGMLAGGNMRQKYLLNIVDNLPEGISEIMMHPGNDNIALGESFTWKYHWQQELAAVKSVELRTCVEDKHIQLISFRELANV